MQISIKGEFGKIRRDIKRQRAIINKATNQALNRTLDNTYTRTIRAVNAETEVKQKLLRKRIRKYHSRDRRRKQPAMWVGTLEYKLTDLARGKLTQTSSGVGVGRQGRFNIPDAFIINWRAGQGVYQRKGPGKWNIRAVYYDITDRANKIAEKIVKSAFTQRFFEKEFKRRFEMLNRRRRR